MKKGLFFWIIVFTLSITVNGQTFKNIQANIPNVWYTVTAWGDFDNDNDVDLILGGQKQDGTVVLNLYNYEGNDNFSISNVTNIPPLNIGACETADYNGDGNLDFAIMGFNYNTYLGYTKIFKNNGDGTFTELSTGLPQTYMGDLSWADYDGDGDLDLAISGFIDQDPYYISRIYKNNGDDTFSEVQGTNFPGTMYGKFKWADYDNDGDMDFVLTGFENDFISKIYKNNGDGTFTDSGINIHKGWLGDVEWADYNNDGNIDLVVSGTGGDGTERYCILYKNNGDGTFTELNAGFPGVSHSSLEWADFDLDGDIDLFICGTEDTPGTFNYISTIFLNNGDDTFTESASANLPAVYWGESKVADFNNDGKPDLLLSGLNDADTAYTAIFRNDTELSDIYSITFRVDMTYETVSGEGMHIAGSFQGWDPGATAMTDAGNNIYEYTQTFSEGETLEYKFVNGNAWGDEESVPDECSQNGNRYFTVPAHDTVLSAVCFGSCSECQLPVLIALRVDMTGQTVSPDGVHVAGSFQGWDPSSSEMTYIDNNIYEITISVAGKNQIQYKFINGISWEGAESVPEECGTPDGFGGFNRYLDVPEQDTVLQAVCFGSCEPCSVGMTENNKTTPTVYPNPFKKDIMLKYETIKSGETKITVYNSMGSTVFEKTIKEDNPGQYEIALPLGNLSKGIYILELINGNKTIKRQKLIKE